MTMKRLVVFTMAFVLLGIAGWADGISGSWQGKLTLIPGLSLDETSLELDYGLADGWTLTSTSTYEAGAFKEQRFEAQGSVGGVELKASMAFAPGDETLRETSYVIPDSWTGWGYDLTIIDGKWVINGPHFKEAELSASFTLDKLSLDLEVAWVGNKDITLGAAGTVDEYLFYLDIPPYDITDHTMVLQPHPDLPPLLDGALASCNGRYFRTYGEVSLVATKVTFEVRDIDDDSVVYSHSVTGQFEVYYYDDASGTVILTLGADTYLWQYFNHYLTEEGLSFDPAEYYYIYTIDPEDVEAVFLFPEYMAYTLTVDVDPLSAEVIFDDVSTGIQFREATISLSDLGLCCGVTYDLEAKFTKCRGFEYAKFSIDNLFELCCGISFGGTVEFGADYKKVTVTPSWEGIEGCVTVYGDLDWEGHSLSGWNLYGWKIGCEFSDCNVLTIVTALDSAWYNANVEDVFEEGEFEYVKFHSCGSACCGGDWSLDLQTFFQHGGSLFGISRTAVSATVPVMDNLSFTVELEVPDVELSLGWNFAF
jgi:hypothetical protein